MSALWRQFVSTNFPSGEAFLNTTVDGQATLGANLVELLPSDLNDALPPSVALAPSHLIPQNLITKNWGPVNPDNCVSYP